MFYLLSFFYIWLVEFDFQTKLFNRIVGATPILSATNSAL
jgi:hypothetical protein